MSKMTDHSIKSWPSPLRPRERLRQYGAAQLSDAELLAIVLRSGSQQASVLLLAEQLLTHYGQLNAILDASWDDLSQFHGIGLSKYCQLMAIKELAKRYVSHHLQHPEPSLKHSEQLMQYLRLELLQESREVVAVLCLDAQLRKISFKKLFFGSIHHCQVSINQILRFAITQHATFLVLAHNHPQAPAVASAQDIQLTVQLKQACHLVEIELIDHCIISAQGSFSFAEQKLI